MSGEVVLSGRLAFVSLADTFQLLHSTGSTGMLSLQYQYAEGRAIVYFENGNPINASYAGLVGQKAVYALFGWLDGDFEFHNQEVKVEVVIKQNPIGLIMDALRLVDEGVIQRVGPPEGADGLILTLDGQKPVIRGSLADYLYVVNEEFFDEGDVIVEEGSFGNWFWIILSGAVEVIKNTPKGPLTLLSLGNGSYVGSLASFLGTGNVRTATVRAIGQVQLGLMDNNRLYQEFSNYSTDLQNSIIAMSVRLQQATLRIAEMFMNENRLEEMLRGKKPVIKQGDNREGVFQIEQGEAVVFQTTDNGYLPLAYLGPGDFIGRPPFVEPGHEPYFASVYASPDVKVRALDLAALKKEFDGMSYTFKNIAKNMAGILSVTTMIAGEYLKQYGPGKGSA
jgi:CRP-like cAMP-binding protein